MLCSGRKFLPQLLFSLASWIFIPGTAHAQPDWLKRDIQNSVAASVAPEASAIILTDEREVRLSADNRARSRIRYAVKILNSTGEGYAVLSQSVTPTHKVENLKGWLVSVEGGTKDLSDEDVVEVAGGGNGITYGDARVLMARFPLIRSGDVAAYEYTLEENDLTSLFQSFEFQVQQPVMHAQLSLTLPDGWKVHKSEWRMGECAFEQKDNLYTWTATTLPLQPEEPLMPSWHFLSRRIELTCYSPSQNPGNQFSDWRSVSTWYADLTAPAATPDDAITKQTQNLIGGLATPFDRLEQIAKFVRDDIRYVGIEIGKERWQPRPASTTLYNRYGDCKDKTALMRAMLRAANIPSVAVLANSEYAVERGLPTPFQFNHCIIGLALKDMPNARPLNDACSGGWIFFDPTDPSTRLGSLPTYLRGATVLLAAPALDSIVVTLPQGQPEDNLRRYLVNATLSADGSISSSITVKYYGNLALESAHEARTIPKNKIVEAWQTRLATVIPSPTITGYSQGSAGDSSWETFQLEASHYLTQAGSLEVFKPDFLHPAEPPALTKSTRAHPIWLSDARRTETDISWHLPAGWKIETTPDPIQAHCDAGSLECRVTTNAATVHYHSVEQYEGRLLAREQYELARSFSNDLSAMRMLSVLLQKPQ